MAVKYKHKLFFELESRLNKIEKEKDHWKEHEYEEMYFIAQNIFSEFDLYPRQDMLYFLDLYLKSINKLIKQVSLKLNKKEQAFAPPYLLYSEEKDSEGFFKYIGTPRISLLHELYFYQTNFNNLKKQKNWKIEGYYSNDLRFEYIHPDKPEKIRKLYKELIQQGFINNTTEKNFEAAFLQNIKQSGKIKWKQLSYLAFFIKELRHKGKIQKTSSQLLKRIVDTHFEVENKNNIGSIISSQHTPKKEITQRLSDLISNL